MKRLKAELILVFIALIWGGTFVIIKLSLLEFPPFYFLFIRFLAASILFIIIFFNKLYIPRKDELFAGLWLGILLFLGFASQITGLVYTTASNSALITGVNILIVPFAQYFIIRKKVGIENWIGIIIVLCGLFLLTKPQENGINKGDLITLICAISWAFYIIYLDIYTRKHNLYMLVLIQFLVVTFITFPIALCLENINVTIFTPFPVFALLYTSVLATLLASYLLNKYQKETTPVRAAILITFEQPSAVILAIVILKDSFTAWQLTGGVMMITGILFCETFEYIRTYMLNLVYRKRL